MTEQTIHQQVQDLVFALKIPDGRRFQRSLAGWRQYRGKKRYVVGYEYSKAYSHHMSGLVYDCILAYGDSEDEAMQKLRAKVPE